MSKEFPNIF